MKNRIPAHGLSIGAKCAAALDPDVLVKVSADETVAKADADAVVIGRTITKVVDGETTIESTARELSDIKFAAALTAGTPVKMAAPDGTTGENRVTTFDPASDPYTRFVGVVWKGAGSGATGTVLFF